MLYNFKKNKYEYTCFFPANANICLNIKDQMQMH